MGTSQSNQGDARIEANNRILDRVTMRCAERGKFHTKRELPLSTAQRDQQPQSKKNMFMAKLLKCLFVLFSVLVKKLIRHLLNNIFR